MGAYFVRTNQEHFNILIKTVKAYRQSQLPIKSECSFSSYISLRWFLCNFSTYHQNLLNQALIPHQTGLLIQLGLLQFLAFIQSSLPILCICIALIYRLLQDHQLVLLILFFSLQYSYLCYFLLKQAISLLQMKAL